MFAKKKKYYISTNCISNSFLKVSCIFNLIYFFWSIYCQTLMAKGREWNNKIEKNKKKIRQCLEKKNIQFEMSAGWVLYFDGRTSSSSMSRPLFVCFLLYWMWYAIVQQLCGALLYKQFIISIIEWNRLNGKFDVFLVWWCYGDGMKV